MNTERFSGELKEEKIDLSYIRNRALATLHHIGKRRAGAPKNVCAVVTGSTGVDHHISFESLARVNEALASMMGLQVLVHRP